VNGVRAAKEENFLFSYNITSLTKAIRKAMNRERTNVGRSAYSDRVKSILLSCQTKEVASELVNDLKDFHRGTLHDEVEWIDIQEHAVKILSAQERIAFVTPDDFMHAGGVIDEAVVSGIEIVTIPERLRERISGQVDISGEPIRDLSQFVKELADSFEFKFVDKSDLTEQEKEIFELTEEIISLIGTKPCQIRQILISETMRRDPNSFVEAEGIWYPSEGQIVCKRSSLKSLSKYAGVLLHEVGHVSSGALDCSRQFELELTKILGIVAFKAINSTL